MNINERFLEIDSVNVGEEFFTLYTCITCGAAVVNHRDNLDIHHEWHIQGEATRNNTNTTNVNTNM